MNFSNEIHVDTVHVVRRYVVELLYTLPWESLAWGRSPSCSCLASKMTHAKPIQTSLTFAWVFG